MVLNTPINLEKLTNIAGLEDIDKECCWSYYSKGTETVLC